MPSTKYSQDNSGNFREEAEKIKMLHTPTDVNTYIRLSKNKSPDTSD